MVEFELLSKAWTFVSQAGVPGILLALVVAFQRGWIVPQRYYDAVALERDQWKAYALKGISLADKVIP